MKNYPLYQLKKCLLPFGVMVFAGLFLYLLPLSLPSSRFASRLVDATSYLAVGLCVACVAIPVWAFRYKMNRRSTDLYFSLPIKRGKLLLTHYLGGFAAIFAAYTIVFFAGFIVIAINSDGLSLGWILCLYPVSVPSAYVMYSVMSFAYTRANNIIDGLIFMAFAALALFAVTLLVSHVAVSSYTEIYDPQEYGYDAPAYTVSRTRHYIYYEYFTPFSPIVLFTDDFVWMARGYNSGYFTTNGIDNTIELVNIIVSLVVNVALAIGCTYGIYALEKRNKAEDCEQNSDSIFGYKTMIPLFVFTLCGTLMAEGSMLAALFVAAAGYFVTAVWKRSFKIGYKPLLILVIAIAAGIGSGLLIYKLL